MISHMIQRSQHLLTPCSVIKCACSAAFAAALGTNSTLRHLDLGSNRQLSASAVQQIANAASSRGDECRLSHLDLTGISLQVRRALVVWLYACHKLQCVDLERLFWSCVIAVRNHCACRAKLGCQHWMPSRAAHCSSCAFWEQAWAAKGAPSWLSALTKVVSQAYKS